MLRMEIGGKDKVVDKEEVGIMLMLMISYQQLYYNLEHPEHLYWYLVSYGCEGLD